ncbi:MAG: hypothetical protein LBM64_07990 [Deltaproteobacteria bacterium]|nr:hypothetical protein [Deltaproteobacteria bacterium]
MFFLRKLKPTLPAGFRYSARERFIRTFLMTLCIALVCWGFWENSNRYVQKFNIEGRITDKSGLLAYGYKEEAGAVMGRIDEKYGNKIQIKISPLPITPSDAIADTLLVGVCPGSAQFELYMPKAWQDALGYPFLLGLRDEVMRPAFDAKAWEKGLITVLERLESRMGELVASQEQGGRP